MAIRMSLVELKAIFAGLVFVCGGVSVLLRSNFIFLLLACCMQEEKKTHSALPASERENRRQAAPQRLRIEYGYLTTLPDDYTGPRHIVTLQQLPPESPGEDWFEWEEQPGPEPAPNTTGANDEFIVQVCYVEGKAKA